MNDTICAIATANGVGAISIIKVSGPESIKIVDSIFSGKLKKSKDKTLNYGFIVDGKEKIDEVLVSVMYAPKTFTTEDIVEINCHGGIAVTNKILELLLVNGCRLAEPGEFTKRAYLNGRIDLVEAEAISDLIAAETEKSSNLAINQIDGKLSKRINKIRDDLLNICETLGLNPEKSRNRVNKDTGEKYQESTVKDCRKAIQQYYIDKYRKEGTLSPFVEEIMKMDSPMLALQSKDKRLNKIRDDLLNIQANIEVNIDYPEYEDIEVLTAEKLLPKVKKIKTIMKKMLEEAKDGKIIRSGINVAIIGKPNVGKSSILNFFLNENKAIVTNIAGTTRDIVEGKITLKGILINFIDTAGIRGTEDQIEKIGINKSIESLKNSDLVLFVLDNNSVISVDDLEILEMLKNKKFIIFINKSDLTKNINNDIINNYVVVEGNTIEEHGLDKLKEKIVEIFNLENISGKDLTYLSNSRQIYLMKQALQSIESGIEAMNSNLPVDVIGIDLSKAWSLLGEIIGDSYDQELLDKLFSNFCLGK